MGSRWTLRNMGEPEASEEVHQYVTSDVLMAWNRMSLTRGAGASGVPFSR